MELEKAFEKINMSLTFQDSFIDCYNQLYRYYHNIDHIKEMLKYVPEDHTEIEIILDSILFHDIVQLPYPTPLGLNESLSGAEYVFYTSKFIPYTVPYGFEPPEEDMEYERRVIEAITATSRHLEDQKFLKETSKIVLDLDLSTFALPYEEYSIWRDKVEKENEEIYKEIASSKEIMAGRYNFFSNLLKREKLFYVKTEWETQARENLQKDMLMYVEILDRGKI